MTKKRTNQPASLANQIAARWTARRLPTRLLQRAAVTTPSRQQTRRMVQRRQRLRGGLPIQRRPVKALNHRHFGQDRQAQYLVPPAKLRKLQPETVDNTADLFLAGQASSQATFNPAMDEGTAEPWTEESSWPPVSMAQLREILATRDQTTPPPRSPSPPIQRSEPTSVPPGPVKPPPRVVHRVKPMSRIEEIPAHRPLPAPSQPETKLPELSQPTEVTKPFELTETLPEAPIQTAIDSIEDEPEEVDPSLSRRPELVEPITVESSQPESIRPEPETPAQIESTESDQVKPDSSKHKVAPPSSVQTQAQPTVPRLKPTHPPGGGLKDHSVGVEPKSPKPRAKLIPPEPRRQTPSTPKTTTVQTTSDSPTPASSAPQSQTIGGKPLSPQVEPVEAYLASAQADQTQAGSDLPIEEFSEAESQPNTLTEPDRASLSSPSWGGIEGGLSILEPSGQTQSAPETSSRTQPAPETVSRKPMDRLPASSATPERTVTSTPTLTSTPSIDPIPGEQPEASRPHGQAISPESPIDDVLPPVQLQRAAPTVPVKRSVKPRRLKAQPGLKHPIQPQAETGMGPSAVVTPQTATEPEPATTVTYSMPLKMTAEGGSLELAQEPAQPRAKAIPPVRPLQPVVQLTPEPVPVQRQPLPPAPKREPATVARQVAPADTGDVAKTTSPAEEADTANTFDLDQLARQIVPLIKRRLKIERQQLSRW